MRRSGWSWFTGLMLVFAVGAMAQQGQPVRPARSVQWIYDPVANVMRAEAGPQAVQPSGSEASPAAATAGPTTYTGTIDVVLTVKLVSSLPTGAVVRCGTTVLLDYEIIGSTTIPSGLQSNSESVDGTVRGSTATCMFSIPYSWTVPASSTTAPVTIRGISGAVGVTESALNSAGVVIRTYRSTTIELAGPAEVPANGATTTVAVSTVL